MFINVYLKRIGVYDLYIPKDVVNIIKKMYLNQIIYLLKDNKLNKNRSNQYCIMQVGYYFEVHVSKSGYSWSSQNIQDFFVTALINA